MKKLKSICKYTVSYIAKRRLLIYSILVIIILLPTGSILINKLINNKGNYIEQIQEQVSDEKNNDKKSTTGKINTDAFIDKTMSKHTLSEGFSTLPDDNNSSSSSNSSNQNNTSSNTQPNTSNIVDKSSISGINLEILEGYNFEPKRDLKLKATDKDGSNITDNIIIEKNNVNTTIPGVYSVKASIRLSNGKIKEKEFTVTVKETRLDVSLVSFEAAKQNVKKGEKIGFEVDFKVSKNHVKPVAVMLNGQEQVLYEGNQNIINRLINKKNYKLFVDAGNIAGEYEYNLEYVKMSNGTWISLGENIVTVNVLKQEVSVNNFTYKEESENKKVNVNFNLTDLDNSASNLRLELSKDNNLLENINLDKKDNYSMQLSVNQNGRYNLKILSDINLNQNINEENTVFNKVIFETVINISNIDQTNITGNNIEIIQGDKFDFRNDLDLKATDFDGEDITDKIEIDGNNIDTNIEGKQNIVVYVINKYGNKYTKEFYITVSPVIENQFSLSRMLFGNFSNNESRSVSIKSSSKKTITGSDMESFTHNVEVNGTVTKVDGNLPAGKIEVELPTAISFTVDQDGNIPTVNYVVNNKGSVDLSIYVSGFKDNNSNGGITINPLEDDISLLDRSNIHLKLTGNTKTEVDLGKQISVQQELLRVKSQETGIVQLKGDAGKANNDSIDKKGISDQFTLIFKIKKS